MEKICIFWENTHIFALEVTQLPSSKQIKYETKCKHYVPACAGA